MALTKKEVTEEKVQSKKTETVEGMEDVPRSANQDQVIIAMQERIAQMSEQLNRQLSNPTTQGGSTDKLLETYINKLNADKTTTNGQFNFDDVYVSEDIDEADVLPRDQWVEFVTHKVMHIIVDDKRNGRNIRAPFDKIVFRYESTKKVVQGRETDLIHLSTYTCKSKKELEWLRSHTRFGISFFDNIKAALTTDVEKATKLAKSMIMLQRMGQAQIIDMCRQRNLPVSSSLDEMRANLAYHTVEAEMERIKNAQRTSSLEQDAEAVLIGKNLIN